MLGSLATYLLRVTLALAVGFVALTLALLWRLEAGPIRLAFLDQPIATALDGLAPELTAEVGGTLLARSGWGVALQVAGVRLRRDDGTPILVLPALAIRPSFGALLLGQLVIARVDVADAEIALTRRADGAWWLGAADGGTSVAVQDLIQAPGAGGHSQAGLPRIGLERTRVTLDDQRAGGRLELTNGDLVIAPVAGRVDVTLSAALRLESTVAPIRAVLTLPVRAQASVALNNAGVVGAVDFNLAGDAGELVPAGDAGPPLALTGLEAMGSYDPDAETVRLRRLAAVVGASRVDAKASVILGDAPTLAFDGTVDALALTALTRLWPVDLATAVRTWLIKGVRDGVLRRCRVQLGASATLTDPAAGRGESPAVVAAAAPGAFDVACDFDGVTAHYLPPLDPIRRATGSARLTADRFRVDLKAGQIGACQVEAGTLTMNLTVKPPTAVITADLSGASADVLALVDEPPLVLVTPLGIAPKDLGGRSRVHAELRLPVKTGLTGREVGLQATAALTEASLPPLVAGIGIKDGQLEVRIDGRTIEVKGTTGMTGLTAVATPVTMALTIAPGTRTQDQQVTFAFDGDGLVARGTASLAGTTVTALAVDRLRLGRNDLAGTLRRRPAGDYEATLTGSSLDLEALLADPRLASADAATLAARYQLSLRVDRVWASRDLEIRELRGSVQGDGGRLGTLALTGTLAPRGDFNVTFDGRVEGRRIVVTSDQAGRLLQALSGFDQIVGGRLTLDAITDQRGPEVFLEGTMVMRDFKLVRAPILAKVLALGSLAGTAALVQGDGLPVNKARVPFRWEAGRLDVHAVRAIGAVGLTADGGFDRRAGTCDLRGNIIPAYTLNTALGRIPLIGGLLVGGKGEGVFGIAYRVSGMLADPAVSVNPLTSVTPTLLRTWFVDPFVRGMAGVAPGRRPRAGR